MRDRIYNFFKKIKWKRFIFNMIRSIGLLGIGFPVVMLVLGLFLRFFPSLVNKSNEILNIGSFIRFAINGITMGLMWGLIINAYEIFLFQSVPDNESGQGKNVL